MQHLRGQGVPKIKGPKPLGNSFLLGPKSSGPHVRPDWSIASCKASYFENASHLQALKWLKPTDGVHSRTARPD